MAVKKNATPDGKNGTKVEAKFSKQQLIGSKYFQHRRDALTAVLRDDQRYTLKEAEAAINDFLGKKV